MWIVKNLLRGTLTFKGLGISIPTKEEFDLDTLGREQAESSNQILVAFEEGYLQNVFKDPFPGTGSTLDPAQIEDQLQDFRQSLLAELRSTLPQLTANPGESVNLRGELAALRESIAGDMRDLFKGLRTAKMKLQEQRERLLVDQSLSQEDVRARLAVLEEYERNLEKNFERLGNQMRPAGGEGGDLVNKADLLSNI
jgi:hypothetical protein